jgi:hypothetical protein
MYISGSIFDVQKLKLRPLVSKGHDGKDLHSIQLEVETTDGAIYLDFVGANKTEAPPHVDMTQLRIP